MGWNKPKIYVCMTCDKLFQGNQNTKKHKDCGGRNIRIAENKDF